MSDEIPRQQPFPSAGAQEGAGLDRTIPPPDLATPFNLPQEQVLPDVVPAQASELATRAYTLPGVVGAISLLRMVEAGEKLPKKMDPEHTRCLGKLGIYTTTLPQNPGWFPGYYRNTARTESELEKQRDNTNTQLKFVREEAEKDFGPALAEELLQVTKVTAPEVYIEPNKYGGTVILGHTTLRVPSVEIATNLKYSFQAMLSASLGKFSKVDVGTDAEGHPIVEIHNLSERDVRDVERGTGAQLHQWFEDETGTRFPEEKRTLPKLEKNGHTFRPDVRSWLVAMRAQYHHLAHELEATYVGFDEERRPRIDDDPLAQTSSAVFDIWRKIINGAREEGYVNLYEVNPDPNAPKLNIMQNVNITRRPTTAAERKEGPGALMAQGKFEQWKVKAYTEAKEHPWRVAFLSGVKVVGKVAGGIGSAVELAASALQYTPVASTATQNFLDARRKWKKRKQEAEAAKPQIQAAIQELEARQAELAES